MIGSTRPTSPAQGCGVCLNPRPSGAGGMHGPPPVSGAKRANTSNIHGATAIHVDKTLRGVPAGEIPRMTFERRMHEERRAMTKRANTQDTRPVQHHLRLFTTFTTLDMIFFFLSPSSLVFILMLFSGSMEGTLIFLPFRLLCPRAQHPSGFSLAHRPL